MNINKGVFAKICKELQIKSNLDFTVSSINDNMLATTIVDNKGRNKYIVNIFMVENSIKAVFIDCSSSLVRYYTELKTYRMDYNGDLMRCNCEDENKYIDDFVEEIILMCR